jgi:hypothetical protein
MNAEQLQHQSIANEFLYSVNSEDFTELHVNDQLMLDDFEWEECESEYAAESLPSYLLAFIKEGDWE